MAQKEHSAWNPRQTIILILLPDQVDDQHSFCQLWPWNGPCHMQHDFNGFWFRIKIYLTKSWYFSDNCSNWMLDYRSLYDFQHVYAFVVIKSSPIWNPRCWVHFGCFSGSLFFYVWSILFKNFLIFMFFFVFNLLFFLL